MGPSAVPAGGFGGVGAVSSAGRRHHSTTFCNDGRSAAAMRDRWAAREVPVARVPAVVVASVVSVVGVLASAVSITVSDPLPPLLLVAPAGARLRRHRS